MAISCRESQAARTRESGWAKEPDVALMVGPTSVGSPPSEVPQRRRAWWLGEQTECLSPLAWWVLVGPPWGEPSA